MQASHTPQKAYSSVNTSVCPFGYQTSRKRPAKKCPKRTTKPNQNKKQTKKRYISKMEKIDSQIKTGKAEVQFSESGIKKDIATIFSYLKDKCSLCSLVKGK